LENKNERPVYLRAEIETSFGETISTRSEIRTEFGRYKKKKTLCGVTIVTRVQI